MRTAELRTPRPASARSAFTARARPATGPSVGSGSASVATRPGIHGVPETVTIGPPLPTSSAPNVDSVAVLPPVDVALAQHVLAMPAGFVGTRSGPVFSTAENLGITVYGRGGHG